MPPSIEHKPRMSVWKFYSRVIGGLGIGIGAVYGIGYLTVWSPVVPWVLLGAFALGCAECIRRNAI